MNTPPPRQGIASEAVERERVERAIEDDLQRQVNVQSGCEYHRADESGVASASMNIVVSELARAAILAMRQVEVPKVGELVGELRAVKIECHHCGFEEDITDKAKRGEKCDNCGCYLKQSQSVERLCRKTADMLERLTSQGGGC